MINALAGAKGLINSILFKFVSSLEHVEDIASGKIRLARISELNDPMELAPRLDKQEVIDSLHDLRKRGHSKAELSDLLRQAAMMKKLAPHLRALPVPQTQEEANSYINLPFFENFEFLEAAFEAMISSIVENSSVACFTRRWNSLPMWAHYAARGNGFIVCYEDLDRFFKGDETGWLNELHLVRYEDKLHGISFYPDSYARIFFHQVQRLAIRNGSAPRFRGLRVPNRCIQR